MKSPTQNNKAEFINHVQRLTDSLESLTFSMLDSSNLQKLPPANPNPSKPVEKLVWKTSNVDNEVKSRRQDLFKKMADNNLRISAGLEEVRKIQQDDLVRASIPKAESKAPNFPISKLNTPASAKILEPALVGGSKIQKASPLLAKSTTEFAVKPQIAIIVPLEPTNKSKIVQSPKLVSSVETLPIPPTIIRKEGTLNSNLRLLAEIKAKKRALTSSDKQRLFKSKLQVKMKVGQLTLSQERVIAIVRAIDQCIKESLEVSPEFHYCVLDIVAKLIVVLIILIAETGGN